MSRVPRLLVLLLLSLIAMMGSVTGHIVSAQSGTGTATPTASIATPEEITIWWAASVYPLTNSAARRALDELLIDFQRTTGSRVVVRLKGSDSGGGLAAQIATTQIVAPAALPDMVLLRRADLAVAARSGVLADVSSVNLGISGMFASAAQLGRVDGSVRGIPFAVDALHIVYKRDMVSSAPTTLDALLAARQPYLFAASSRRGLHPGFVAQYLSAGGKLADATGRPLLEREALLQALRFYQRARQSGLITDDALDFTSAAQYVNQFLTGSAGIAQMESSTYLRLTDAERSRLRVSPLPMPGDSGDSLAVVDGWLWAVVERDRQRTTTALALLRRLLADEWYSRFCREMDVLPARESALRLWPDDAYTRFLLDLMQQPAAPPVDMLDPTLATALQAAFEDVIAGRQTATAAADTALEQFKR